MIDNCNLPPGVSASDPHLTGGDATYAPDTTDAVTKAIAYKAGHYDTDAEHVDDIPNEDWLIEPQDEVLARIAIEADRKSLTEQGYVIVKPVKMPAPDEPYRNDYLRGWAKCLDALRRLGLPVEVTP